MMQVTLWGTRGSLPTPGPDTERYGGNTSCVEVRGADGAVLVLDAGTGIRRLGPQLTSVPRVDLLLTHLHMDHIQGLGFFAPLFVPDLEVHIWGPASPILTLSGRLARYLSPPLFPVRLRDLPCRMELHELASEEFEIGNFQVCSALVCHPNPTVGYRIMSDGSALTYLPDHEPAMGLMRSYLSPDWTSGFSLAAETDLLIHDAQYTAEEYARCVGWGHSSMQQAFDYAAFAGARHFVPFHHDPAHSDDELDRLFAAARDTLKPPFPVTPATEGATFQIGG